MNIKENLPKLKKFFEKYEQHNLLISCSESYDNSINVFFNFLEENIEAEVVVNKIVEDFKKNFDFEIILFEGHGWFGDGKITKQETIYSCKVQ